MKILFVVESHAKQAGGGPRYWAELSERLIQRGHQVIILSGTLSDSPFASPNTIGLTPVRHNLRHRSGFTLARRFLFMMRFIPAVRSFARKWHPDIIHTVPPIASEAALHTGSVLETPVIASILSHVEKQWRHLEPNKLRARLFRSLESRAIRRPFSRTICLTHRSEQVLLSEGVPRERIVYVPHAVDIRRFNSDASPRFRKALDISKDAFVIGYAGALVGDKGVNHLLRAMTLLSEQEDIYLLIAGEMPTRDLWKQLSDVKGLENVVFLGSLDHQDMPAFMASLDLFVIPSYAETLPTTLLEALATGTPVMATVVGDVAEILQQGFGIPLQIPLAEQIAKLLVKWMYRRVELQRMGKSGQHYVRKYHNWEQTSQLTEGVYQACLQAK